MLLGAGMRGFTVIQNLSQFNRSGPACKGKAAEFPDAGHTTGGAAGLAGLDRRAWRDGR
jgi:hypothetical protein